MEPQTRLGTALLTKFAYGGVDLTAFREELSVLCQHRATRAGALMDLSTIDQLQGDLHGGLARQAEALEICAAYRTHGHPNAPLTLLVFAAPIHMGGNTPVEFLLPGKGVTIITLYLPHDPADDATLTLPAHDVAFCAAPADAADAHKTFDRVRALSQASDAPVLNLPARLIKPERDRLPALLGAVPGLRLPKTVSVDRADLCAALQDGWEAAFLHGAGPYPYVVRPAGSHAGQGLQKITSRADFLDYLDAREEPTFFVSEFINYAGPGDGLFRKYRVILVDGVPYPCHMAISDHWDVWYMNADMSGSAAKRAEEAAFMAGFADDFAPRHARAFEALYQSLGLDYVGVDCAEDAEGNLVVFEADNALIVHDMDCTETFPYKTAPMQQIFAAFARMLRTKCDAPSTTTLHQVPPLHADPRQTAAFG
ncbi:ATP-grasp domain-containing protein [Gymnodinialimonas sp.]